MKQCNCEHWQICPTCKPRWFDTDGNMLPPEPTPLQSAHQRISELEQALKEKDTCARQCEGAAYRAEAKRLRALNTELIAAADALIKRWDSPSWKDVPPTRDAIERLRAAAEKAKEPPQ